MLKTLIDGCHHLLTYLEKLVVLEPKVAVQYSRSNFLVQSCTITPLNPTTLTATGGALVSGTTDVRIQCVCTVTNDDQRVRWYDINENFLVQSTHPTEYVAGSPYFIPNNPNGNTDVTLVIPIFNDSYDGTYNCGIRVSHTVFTSPSATVTLTIGELMINTVSYLYVAT